MAPFIVERLINLRRRPPIQAFLGETASSTPVCSREISSYRGSVHMRIPHGIIGTRSSVYVDQRRFEILLKAMATVAA